MSTANRSGPVSPPTSPTARRGSGPGWRDPRLVIGIVIVTGSVLLGARLLAGADDTVGVWSAQEPLSAGTTVKQADLVRREVRFSDPDVAGRYVSADTTIPADMALSRAVGPGELLPRAALGSGSAGRLVQVPLTVDSGAVPATVRVGSVVDVWVTPDQDTTSDRLEPATRVFRDVAVLAVPAAESALGPRSTRQVIIGTADTSQADLAGALAILASGTTVLTKRG